MKIGDKIVCLNVESDEYIDITNGSIYIIKRIDTDDFDADETYYITDDKNRTFGYFAYRFVSLKEHRKLKLKKIHEKG